MTDSPAVKSVSLPPELPGLLLSWYDKERRILPWREDPTPYHVWVSEIMLQQTRVDTVIPYYERFLSELPDVQALANAPEDRLLKLWEGLGYYSRVRNMQKAAHQIMDLYKGEIPSDPSKLVKLSGIGAYTAAAISSIAFQVPAASVDGNLLRVYARLTSYEEDIRTPAAKKLAETAYTEVLPPNRPGDMNQALMDLGATICLPNGAPLCESCPVQSICSAHKSGQEASIPKAVEKKAKPVRQCTVLIIRLEDHILLHKRPKKGLLAGLYEFPNIDGNPSDNEIRAFLEPFGLSVQSIHVLSPAKHIFTHLVWEMKGYEILVQEAGKRILPQDYSFVSIEAIREEAALPSAFAAYSALLKP